MGLYKINKAKLRQFLFFLWVGPPVFKPPQIQPEVACDNLALDMYGILCYSIGYENI
tara:strand:- start:606 stop:776 length:171 start_codon:yes stop_codon:yes gene_type:complete